MVCAQSLLYPLFTHDCMARYASIIKFADDTTVVGLIPDSDKTAYREEVRDMTVWCQDNKRSLNMIKTKEMIVDYRKRRTEHAPILIDRAVVEQVESFKFLGVTNKHHLQTNMVQAHKDSREDGTTKPITPQETEKIWHGSSDPQNVLQLHHQRAS